MNRLGVRTTRVEARPWGDGGLVLHATPPGPAGVATARLAGGAVTVTADVAEPDHVVAVAVERFEDPAVADVLDGLLDDPTLEGLRAWWPRRADRPNGAVVWSGVPDPGVDDPRVRRSAGYAARIVGAVEVGPLALAASEAIRRSRPPGVTALALAEVAVRGVAVGHLRPDPRPGDVLRAALAGLDRLDDVDTDWIDRFAPAVLDDLRRHVVDWPRSLPALDDGPRMIEWLDDLLAPGGAVARRPFGARLRRAAPPAAAPAAEPTALHDLAAGAVAEVAEAAPGIVAPADAAPTATVVLRADLGHDARLVGVEHDTDHLIVHVGGVEAAEVWLRVSARPGARAVRPGPVRRVGPVVAFGAGPGAARRSGGGVAGRRHDRGPAPWRSDDARSIERCVQLRRATPPGRRGSVHRTPRTVGIAARARGAASATRSGRVGPTSSRSTRWPPPGPTPTSAA